LHSSTWLARDSIENMFVAVKALTGHITDMYERALVWEADALRLVSQLPTSPNCIQLLNEFTTPGRGSAGSHMCFVMPLYGGDVKALAKGQKAALPLPLVKRIILHLLRGIVYAHERGIVHTDIKPDNIFFSTTMTVDDIEAWVAREPPRRHALELSYDGPMQVAVSQPLPMISQDEAMRATYVLADFGCARPSNLHNSPTITSLPLRPPEVYLEADWDKPADIWTFGCLVFELVTSELLFRYQPNNKFGLDETENMLYQMMLLTGEVFRAAQLQVSPKAPAYFTSACQLKKNPDAVRWPIKTRFENLGVISDGDAVATVSLIERCLRLNPAHRPTAAELLSDPWFDGVE